jgi:hypothetical protein
MRALTLVFAWALSIGAPARADIRRDLEIHALRYFVEQSHPKTGLVKDRALNTPGGKRTRKNQAPMASLAATGFGMAVLANAATRGFVTRAFAMDRIHRALAFTRLRLEHRKGWLYHFVHWETGARFGLSEISTVDTAWFLAGALYASAVFPGTGIEKLTRDLYERLDFADMMTHGGAAPGKRTLSMGWTPEQGYLPYQWDSYSEHVLLLVLGLGHPTRPLPQQSWEAWARYTLPIGTGEFLLGHDQSLFIHQYSHLFLDFRALWDGPLNYASNSRLATERDRELCASDARFATYREGFWGLSASGSPRGYFAFSPTFHNGTVCPACAGASAPFLPALVLADLEKWKTGPYAAKLWGRYGFPDSLNLDDNWFDPDAIGITVGALYLALANLDHATSLWGAFQRIPEVRRGLSRAFQSSPSFR